MTLRSRLQRVLVRPPLTTATDGAGGGGGGGGAKGRLQRLHSYEPGEYGEAWRSTRQAGTAAVASFLAAALTEIYLCDVCSCQDILRRNGRGQTGSGSKSTHSGLRPAAVRCVCM
jgi:hypothetical protein